MLQQFDNRIFRYSPLIVVVAAVVYNLSLNSLLDTGYSSSMVLLWRGLLSFSLIVTAALAVRQSVFPQKLHLQVLRLTNSGIGLMLAFQAYKGLTASTVAMVSRLDIPVAILIGFITGRRLSDARVRLSVFAIGTVLSIVYFSGTIHEDATSLLMAIIAVCMTSVSYLLIKQSTHSENNFSIVNTTNIGCIAIGAIGILVQQGSIFPGWQHAWLFLLASCSQLALNYTSAVVYRQKEVERAQRPYLAGSIAVMVIEQIITWQFFAPLHIFYIILVLSLIYMLTMQQLPRKRHVRLWGLRFVRAVGVLPFFRLAR